MEQATDTTTMIRAQAKCQVLRLLVGDFLENQALGRLQHTVTAPQPYMATDSFGEEEEPTHDTH